MGAYHLWHPAYVASEPLTLEAFVTLGEALLPPLAGGALTESARALGLPPGEGTATLEAVRTHYFGSYRDSGDWADRWDLAWRWRTAVGVADSRPPLPRPPEWGWFDVEAAGAVPEPPTACPCLLVVDAATPDEARRAAAVVERVSPGARVEHGRALDRFPQLRVDLGVRPVSWYQAGADEAESLLNALGDLEVSLSCTTLDRLG